MTNRSRGRLLGAILACSLGHAIAYPALAADLAPAQRAELAALATGTMQKLVVHDAPYARMEEAFQDKNGNAVTLSDYAGKVVVLNFWATWCPPCVAEMPSLDRLSAAMADRDVAVIAVSNDRGDIDRVAAFFKEKGIESLKVYQDRGNALVRRAGVLGLPVTLILDRQGREIARLIGDAAWDSAEAQAVIARVVALTAPTG